MKLAFLGAPGAGKSLLARKTINKLKAQGRTNWGLVDGYVEALATQTGMPFGANSNFGRELSVITTRWIREAQLFKDQKHSLTCGTFYESFIYTTIFSIFTSTDEKVIAQQSQNAQFIMQILGFIEATTWDYDAIFLLPLPESKKDPEDRNWYQVIDAKLPEVLEGFNKKFFMLDQQTDKEKTKFVIEIIDQIENYYEQIATATYDQSGV